MSLPANTDAERFVLGSILLDSGHYVTAAASLAVEDFSLDTHRRIWRAMETVHGQGEIDRVTVAAALADADSLDAVGGLSYLVSLDDGLPQLPAIDSYIRIVKDKAILRRIIFAAQKLANRASLDEEPSKILADAHTDFLALAEGCTESTLVTPAAIIDAAGGLDRYTDRRNRVTGQATGYPLLDRTTGGLKAGALYLLAARPAQGKTALALNIVERVAVDRQKTAVVFSLEMARDELLDRLICSRARVNTQRFGGGYLSDDERRKVGYNAGEIADGDRILIDDKANTSTTEIHAKIRKQQARGEVALVVVDYLQLLIDGRDDLRVAAASRISRDLKLIAKDCRVPVMALSQLSRNCEQRGKGLEDFRPRLSDLRESGSLEQDADVVLTLFRGQVYFPDREDLRGLADLEVLKHRGGPTGRIPLVWLPEIVRFEEKAE